MRNSQRNDTVTYSFETEKFLLRYLLSSPNVFARCQNILKAEYWHQDLQTVARFILNYAQKYSKLPSPDVVSSFANVRLPLVEDAEAQEPWFLDTIEAFCRHKALELAILASVPLLEQGNRGEIERLIKEANLISLQKDLGTEYFNDPLTRLQRMKDRTGMRPTGWEDLDRKLYGGLNRGEVTIFVGGPGCVAYNTKVRARRIKPIKVDPDAIFLVPNYDYESREKFNELSDVYSVDEIETYCNGDPKKLEELCYFSRPQTLEIGKMQHIYQGVKYYVDSPDGWVPATWWVRKADKIVYDVRMKSGIKIRASYDHLFQVKNGSWRYVRELLVGDILITAKGLDVVDDIKKQRRLEDCYDLSIGHENQRYYTNGISSHNTGKSLFLQNLALNWVEQGLNIVYITLELSEDLIGLRYDAMITKLGTEEIVKNTEDSMLKWNVIVRRSASWGKLQIKAMRGAGTTAADIRAYIREYEIQSGVKVDGLLVDYLDLVYPNNTSVSLSDLFVKDKFTSEELRALAAELNILCATASQLNRCLSENTSVTANGNPIKIKDVNIGDWLDSNEGPVQVVAKTSPSVQKTYRIVTKSGKAIECSKHHLFPTVNGVKSINSGLKVGDVLFAQINTKS
jgi:replicative DNA helicase